MTFQTNEQFNLNVVQNDFMEGVCNSIINVDKNYAILLRVP